MKFKILLVLFLLIGRNGFCQQSLTEKHRYLSLKVGLAASNFFDRSPFGTNKWVPVPVVGLHYIRESNSGNSISIGLTYVEKAGVWNYFTSVGSSSRTDTEVRVKGLDIEIDYNIYFSKNTYFILGWAPGLNIGKSRIKTKEMVSDPDFFRRSIQKDIGLKMSLLLQVGLGFEKKFDNWNMRTEFFVRQYLLNVFGSQSKAILLGATLNVGRKI